MICLSRWDFLESLLFPLSRSRERVGVRASLNQRLQNFLQHRLRLQKHFVVPESQHAKPGTGEQLRAFQIVEHMIRVLPTVKLYDKPRPRANEIDDVSAYWRLSAEAISGEMTVAQETPKQAFCIG